jgi:hypothetical protein
MGANCPTCGAAWEQTDQDFATAWAAYPHKVGKLAAQRAWKKRRPPLDAVLKAIAWQSRTPQWAKRGDNGEVFIPHMSTWINGGRWEDQPVGIIPDWRPELGSWRDECQRVHGGHQGDVCGNQHFHAAKMSYNDE